MTVYKGSSLFSVKIQVTMHATLNKNTKQEHRTHLCCWKVQMETVSL